MDEETDRRLRALETQTQCLLETARLMENSISLMGKWLMDVNTKLDNLYFRQEMELERWRDLWRKEQIDPPKVNGAVKGSVTDLTVREE